MINFKSINILGVRFSTESVNQEKMLEYTSDPDAIGACDDLNDSIYILDNLGKKPEIRTFIHEWSHAVSGVNGFNQSVDPAIAEIICQSYANAIIEMLSQKSVMKFLMGKK